MNMIVLNKESISKDELVEVYKEYTVKSKGSKYHTIENHNYHIGRYGRCVYCMLGSVPVPKCVIVEGLR